MSEYTPDRWVVVEFKYASETIRKVLATWYGGYAGSDSWKLSSGIIGVEEFEKHYEFRNHSGSLYVCHKGSVGMGMYTLSIFNRFKEESKGRAQLEVIEVPKDFSSWNEVVASEIPVEKKIRKTRKPRKAPENKS